MNCITAKMNNVLMDLAIEHYLDKTKRTETPVFTFMSLWNDDEPYPLDEVLFCLEERIAHLEQEFKQNPNQSLNRPSGRNTSKGREWRVVTNEARADEKTALLNNFTPI